MKSTSPTSSPGGSFQHNVVLAAAIVGVALPAIRLAAEIMMAFGAVLVAVLLQAIAEPPHRRLGLRRPLALTLAVVVLVVCVAATVWIFGRQAEAQFIALNDVLPRAWNELDTRLSSTPFGGAALAKLEQWRGFEWLVSLDPKLAADAAGGLAGTIIVLFAGRYLAYHPAPYVDGVLMLFPLPRRERARQVLDQIHRALRTGPRPAPSRHAGERGEPCAAGSGAGRRRGDRSYPSGSRRYRRRRRTRSRRRPPRPSGGGTSQMGCRHPRDIGRPYPGTPYAPDAPGSRGCR